MSQLPDGLKSIKDIGDTGTSWVGYQPELRTELATNVPVLLETPDEALGIAYKRFTEGPIFISNVYPGGACARAGVEPGVAILALNGLEIITEEDLTQHVEAFRNESYGGPVDLNFTVAPYMDPEYAEQVPDADDEGYGAFPPYPEGDDSRYGGDFGEEQQEQVYYINAPAGGQLGLRWERTEDGPVVVNAVWGPMEAAGVPEGLEIRTFAGFDVYDENTFQLALQQWKESGVPDLVMTGVVPMAPEAAEMTRFWPWAGDTPGIEYPPPPQPVGGGFGGPPQIGPGPRVMPAAGTQGGMMGARFTQGLASEFRGAAAPRHFRTPPPGGVKLNIGPGVGRGRGPGRKHRTPGEDWAQYAVRRTHPGGGPGSLYDGYTLPEFEQFAVGGKARAGRLAVQEASPDARGNEPQRHAPGEPPAPAARPLTQTYHFSGAAGRGYYALSSF
eukprot:Hpha_TRINITY_DN2882_c0_g1::TRINITY_DN2882_c0_g1_i1::g.171428::m.171428